LLNTRIIFNEDDLKGFEHCKRSAATYGLNDFAGLSLSSFNDRVYICRSIENAIARHETRLKNVKVTLEVDHRSINSLHFSIHAMLEVNPAKEQVSFDALLQPSSQKYSVNKSRRFTGT
jgi:type VI secretion system protein ImpF